MAYYNVCPNCGSNLDSGERCDCEKEKKQEQEMRQMYFNRCLRMEKNSRQMVFSFSNSGGAVRHEKQMFI